MAREHHLSFQQRSLFQQGFQRYLPMELKQLEWGLRFTPTVCSFIVAYGVFTQQPAVLFFVALLGAWAFIFPASHPIDLFYNQLIAPLFKTVTLPANPFQRRFACLAAGLMNMTAAILFMEGAYKPAMVVGMSLLILQVIVIFTHFCILSWLYEGVMRALGHWQQPLDIFEAKLMLKDAVTLVDVRSQHEFIKGSIKGALNLPLEELEQHINTFRNNTCLLFCNSGTRSHIATEKLKQFGVKNIYNLGDFNRAKLIAGSGN